MQGGQVEVLVVSMGKGVSCMRFGSCQRQASLPLPPCDRPLSLFRCQRQASLPLPPCSCHKCKASQGARSPPRAATARVAPSPHAVPRAKTQSIWTDKEWSLEGRWGDRDSAQGQGLRGTRETLPQSRWAGSGGGKEITRGWAEVEEDRGCLEREGVGDSGMREEEAAEEAEGVGEDGGGVAHVLLALDCGGRLHALICHTCLLPPLLAPDAEGLAPQATGGEHGTSTWEETSVGIEVGVGGQRGWVWVCDLAVYGQESVVGEVEEASAGAAWGPRIRQTHSAETADTDGADATDRHLSAAANAESFLLFVPRRLAVTRRPDAAGFESLQRPASRAGGGEMLRREAWAGVEGGEGEDRSEWIKGGWRGEEVMQQQCAVVVSRHAATASVFAFSPPTPLSACPHEVSRTTGSLALTWRCCLLAGGGARHERQRIRAMAVSCSKGTPPQGLGPHGPARAQREGLLQLVAAGISMCRSWCGPVGAGFEGV
jgi:hypothetical protein